MTAMCCHADEMSPALPQGMQKYLPRADDVGVAAAASSSPAAQTANAQRRNRSRKPNGSRRLRGASKGIPLR